MPTYTFYGCTIEVAKGGQSAKATRHLDADGNALKPPQSAEFQVISEKDAPTPQVQAERWAKGKVVNPKAAKTDWPNDKPATLTKPEAERVAKETTPKTKHK